MNNLVQGQLAELGDMVRATAIPDSCKRATLLCVGRLPSLYSQFSLTYESRYGDEITRLVQGALNELVNNTTAASSEAQKLAASLTERLRALHEESGIPRLSLKSPKPPVASPRPRKAK